MDKIYDLEGAYLIASPKVSHEMLRGALVYIYQVDDGFISGVMLNKPFEDGKTVGDFLAYPKHLSQESVWRGGPLGTERLIAFSQHDREVYITDRLANLSKEQLEHCMFLVGQCIWDVETMTAQIQQGDWTVVGSHYMVPNTVPAEARISYVMRMAGIASNRYVPMVSAEVV